MAMRTTASRGYIAALKLEPGESLLALREFDWACKGPKWRFDERRASQNGEVTTFLFDGRRKLIYSNYVEQNYTRGSFVGSQTPESLTPLGQAYGMTGRTAPDALEADGFSLVRAEQHPVYGPVCVLRGSEFHAAAATTTVWVARDRGYQIVRREMRSNRMGKVISADRTEALQRVAGIWLPSRIVRASRYPGRECAVAVVISDVHVNDVPDSRFTPGFLRRGVLFSSGVPMGIRPDGALGLDPRGTQLSTLQYWSGGPVRLALAFAMLLVLWAVILGTVRAVRGRRT